jgi:hypothetical protein
VSARRRGSVYTPGVKPRQGVYLALGLSLVVVPVLAEVLYQRSADESFADIIEELHRTHPRWLETIGHEFTRFGHGSGYDPSVTLRHDAYAWIRLRLGLPSDLDHPLERDGVASYNAFGVEAYHEEHVDRREFHVFEWNPRRRAFFVTRSRCTEPGCTWIRR